MNGIKCNDKKMRTYLKEDDIGELIHSLQNIGKVIRMIEKKLGIKETPLPTIDLEKIYQGTNEKSDYNNG